MARAGGADQRRRIAAATDTIRGAGYEIREVDDVEPPGTPTAELGRVPAMVDHEARVVKVRRALRGWKLVGALEEQAAAVGRRSP